MVSQTSASWPVTGSGEMPVIQSTTPVCRFSTSQAPINTTLKGQPATSGVSDVHHQSVIPMLQPVRLASQFAATKPLISTSDKVLSTTFTAGAASQYPDSDFEQQTDSTYAVHPFEEEGKMSDQEAGLPEH